MEVYFLLLFVHLCATMFIKFVIVQIHGRVQTEIGMRGNSQLSLTV